MTGYGKGQANFEGKVYSIEIKSLNSKNTDIRCRIPSNLADKEFKIRKLIQEKVLRGRIEVIITAEGGDLSSDYSINKDLFRKFYKDLSALTSELKIESGDLVSSIMRIPSVTTSDGRGIDEKEWLEIQKGINQAIEAISIFRKDEGQVLADDFLIRVASIKGALPKIEKYEETRIVKIKEKLKKHFDELFVAEKVDLNRFEQEVIYYLEKLDITEEKVRLTQHCIYFVEQMQNDNPQIGKKLAFIAQEMGREINTLGSKAQDSDMQQLVVEMKDDLEKIKEQLANIL